MGGNMRLRNKKTGEIAEIKLKLNESLPDAIRRTIKEAGWEEARGPLIKDERVRKAVRAWADKANIKIVRVDRSGSCLVNYPAIIQFFGTPFSELKNREYTIAELCGEEEE